MIKISILVQNNECNFAIDIIFFITKKFIDKKVDKVEIHVAYFKTRKFNLKSSFFIEQIVARKRIKTQKITTKNVANRHDVFRRKRIVFKKNLNLNIVYYNIIELFEI